LAVYGIDEAIRRANLYAEAGVDILFIEAPPSVADMKRICREVNAPMSANMVEGGKTPILTAKELQEIGYCIVTFPLSTLYAAAWGVRMAMKALFKAGTTAGITDRMITFSDFNKIVGLDDLRANETRYYKELFELTRK